MASKTPYGPGVPLGTRTAPTGCFAGLFSDKRDARGYSWSSFPSGSDNAHYWHFNYNFLARQASKTPDGRGFQLRCLQVPLGTLTGPVGGEKASHRQRGTQRAPTSCVAPPGVAEARALLRSADFLLAAQFSGARPEKLLRPTVVGRAPGEIIPDKLIVETGYFPFKARRAGYTWRSPAGISSRLCASTTSEIPL